MFYTHLDRIHIFNRIIWRCEERERETEKKAKKQKATKHTTLAKRYDVNEIARFSITTKQLSHFFHAIYNVLSITYSCLFQNVHHAMFTGFATVIALSSDWTHFVISTMLRCKCVKQNPNIDVNIFMKLKLAELKLGNDVFTWCQPNNRSEAASNRTNMEKWLCQWATRKEFIWMKYR